MDPTFFIHTDWGEVGIAVIETLIMLGVSLPLTVLLGLPLGVLLYLTAPRQLLANRKTFIVLSFCTNLLRSIPFAILLIVLIPLTELLAGGVSYGVRGMIPPLVIGAAPLFARLVETALREIDRGIVEASLAMGASTQQIVFRVLLPEAFPGLFAAVTVLGVTLVSFIAMSGLVGGGGLGDLAVRRGYQSYQPDVMVVTVVLLIVLVQCLQMFGDRLVIKMSHR